MHMHAQLLAMAMGSLPWVTVTGNGMHKLMRIHEISDHGNYKWFEQSLIGRDVEYNS